MPVWPPSFAIPQTLPLPPLCISLDHSLSCSCCLLVFCQSCRSPSLPPLPPLLPAVSHHTSLCWKYTKQRVSPPELCPCHPLSPEPSLSHGCPKKPYFSSKTHLKCHFLRKDFSDVPRNPKCCVHASVTKLKNRGPPERCLPGRGLLDGGTVSLRFL